MVNGRRFFESFSLRWYLCEKLDISDRPGRSKCADMEFASFTCVFAVDSTLDPQHDLTMERVAVAKRKAGMSMVRNFSVTHFDTNLEATTLLSTSDVHEPTL
jgi:hypothetical protein